MVGPGLFFGGFLVWGLIWTLVPLVIAVMLASSRQESIAMAALLTFFLGWIGLAIVYFGQRNVAGAVNRVVAGDPPATRPWPPTGPRPSQTAAPAPIAQRLRLLDGLRASGTITDAEFAARRQAIIDEV